MKPHKCEWTCAFEVASEHKYVSLAGEASRHWRSRCLLGFFRYGEAHPKWCEHYTPFDADNLVIAAACVAAGRPDAVEEALAALETDKLLPGGGKG